jgi:putative tricarboxylic transport membrane protein
MVRARLPARDQAWVQLGAWLQSPVHRRNFVITITCLLFYVLVSELLGFLVCGLLILCVMFRALSVKPMHILPIAIGITLLIHTLFYKGLRVPLPWGVLSPLQW